MIGHSVDTQTPKRDRCLGVCASVRLCRIHGKDVLTHPIVNGFANRETTLRSRLRLKKPVGRQVTLLYLYWVEHHKADDP